MSAQTDFHITIERAAGLVLDAQCAARTAAHGPLPRPHQRLVNRAIVDLDRAQDNLFKARNDPWHQPKPRRNQQLELL